MGNEWSSMNGHRIALRMVFDGVDAATMWRLWTTPEGLTAWWADAAEVDEAACTIHLSWPRMDWHLRGRIAEWDPERRFAFTWRWDHEPALPERTVTVELEPSGEGTGTALALTQGEYGEGPVEAADRQSHIEGWDHFLPRLSAASQLSAKSPMSGR